MIVKYRGLDIKVGTKLKITVSNKSAHCIGVVHTGKVIFKDAAYCLEYIGDFKRDIIPLTNYAEYCKVEILK